MQKSRISLHNHLGRNGRNPGFDETVDLIYEALGCGGIFGIANCNDFRYEKFINQNGKYERILVGTEFYINPTAVYIPKKEIMIIKGQEVFSDKGHFLVFGYHKNIERKNLNDALNEAVDNNAIIGTDHRYYISGLGNFLEQNPDYEGYFDFDEVYNGTSEMGKLFVGPKNSNEKAIENYKKNMQGKLFQNPRNGKEHYIGATAFGDTHQLTRFGMNIIRKSYTIIDFYFMQNLQDISNSYNVYHDMIEELKTALQNSRLDNLVMNPNKLDGFVHAFNMVVVNRLEKIIGK